MVLSILMSHYAVITMYALDISSGVSLWSDEFITHHRNLKLSHQANSRRILSRNISIIWKSLMSHSNGIFLQHTQSTSCSKMVRIQFTLLCSSWAHTVSNYKLQCDIEIFMTWQVTIELIVLFVCLFFFWGGGKTPHGINALCHDLHLSSSFVVHHKVSSSYISKQIDLESAKFTQTSILV